MEFLETEDILLFSILALLVSFWILYEIIKSAVTAAIINANAKMEQAKQNKQPGIQETVWTQKQIEIQGKYDRGEITMEEYKREFNK